MGRYEPATAGTLGPRRGLVAGMAGGLLAVALMAVGFTALLDDVLEGEGLGPCG